MPRTASALATASTAVFLFLILIAGHPNLSGSAQAATATFGMHIVGESPTFDAGLPVLVAGVWHQVALNLSSTLSTPITLRAILPGSGSPSPANTYEWVRYQSNDSWADVRYGTFLRADLSSDDGTHVVFGIGVDGEASPGTWTLIASSGNSTLVTQSVEVQAPRVSYGISAADFQFRVDPFTAADLSSQIGSQHLRLIDQGNVPLRLTVSFDVLRSQLSLENSGVVTHPNSESMYYLHLASGPMPPQIVRANGLANVSVLYVVPSSGSTLLVPTFEQPFGVSVQVGRSGYALKVVGGVVFQTLDTVRVDYGSRTIWQVYVTGSQNVSLDVSASGVRLLGVSTEGHPIGLPATLALSPSSEYPLTIQVEADQAGPSTVTFALHLLATGEVQTFTTTILVNGGPAGTSSGAVLYLWIGGSVGASLVFGFVASSQWKHRRGRVSPRDLSSQNGTKAKRGYNARRRAQLQRRNSRANGDTGEATKSRTKSGDRNGPRTSRMR